MSLVLRIISVILFILAAIAFFGAAGWNGLGLLALGLAAWCVSESVE